MTMQEVEQQLDDYEAWCREFLEDSHLVVFNRLAWFLYMTREDLEVN